MTHAPFPNAGPGKQIPFQKYEGRVRAGEFVAILKRLTREISLPAA